MRNQAAKPKLAYRRKRGQAKNILDRIEDGELGRAAKEREKGSSAKDYIPIKVEMDYIVPISEARGRLPELIKKIAAIGKHLIITRNGRAAAVMISPEEFETLEVKTDPELLRAIIRGEEDMKAEKLYSRKDVFK